MDIKLNIRKESGRYGVICNRNLWIYRVVARAERSRMKYTLVPACFFFKDNGRLHDFEFRSCFWNVLFRVALTIARKFIGCFLQAACSSFVFFIRCLKFYDCFLFDSVFKWLITDCYPRLCSLSKNDVILILLGSNLVLPIMIATQKRYHI